MASQPSNTPVDERGEKTRADFTAALLMTKLAVLALLWVATPDPVAIGQALVLEASQ